MTPARLKARTTEKRASPVVGLVAPTKALAGELGGGCTFEG